MFQAESKWEMSDKRKGEDMSALENSSGKREATRRQFLTRSAGIAAAAGLTQRLSIASSANVAGSDSLKIALIGCGGRGTGAVRDSLSRVEGTDLVVMADVFEDRLENSLAGLKRAPGIGDRIDVSDDRKFLGFDAYKKVIETDVDIVFLTTPPAFRPLHYAAAVAAGKHVFLEKPVCVDGPGFRQVMETNRLADAKNLKVLVGLQRRHQKNYLDGIKRIHDGEIGDIMTIRTYMNMPGQGPSHTRRPDHISEMEWQIRRWNKFTWLSGDHIVEQAVHEIDIANWMKRDEVPVKANGLGGRQVRTGCGNGQIFDHHFVEYTYADGCRHFAQAKQQPGGWSHVSDNAQGTKGSLTVGSGPFGAGAPASMEGARRTRSRWKENLLSPFQVEHQDLIEAIRNDTPLNDGYHGAKSSMTAALGRMATYSGQEVTWEEATQSDASLAPGLEEYTIDSTPPAVPDDDGNYPIAVPGLTKAW
jgi:predicted dehydrogenase